jgi:hypothetical protein
MPRSKTRSPRPSGRPKKRARNRPASPRFVGRDASPVLDKYPPKDPSLAPRGPPGPAATGAAPSVPVQGAPSVAPPGPGTPLAPPSHPLITLDRPFDVDEFASLLGETSIRVTVPREALLEVLHRVSEFMGFGIYVYAITVRPAPTELLKAFVVELQRVDFSAEKGAWLPFVERGTSGAPRP